jgi:hypothetical protein
MHRRIGRLAVTSLGLIAEHREPAVDCAEQSCRSGSHRLPSIGGFIHQEPESELWVVTMRVEQRIRLIRLLELGAGHLMAQSPGIRLASKLEHPTRNRDGEPVCGQLTHEQVELLAGRFAGDRFAAAWRSTSFSCSKNRLRLRRLHNSEDSSAVIPTRCHASTWAPRSEFCDHASQIANSPAICLIVTPSSRCWATATT